MAACSILWSDLSSQLDGEGGRAAGVGLVKKKKKNLKNADFNLAVKYNQSLVLILQVNSGKRRLYKRKQQDQTAKLNSDFQNVIFHYFDIKRPNATLTASEASIHRPCAGLWWQPGRFIPLDLKRTRLRSSQAAPLVDAQTVVLYVLFLPSICVSSAPVGCWKERHTEEWEMPRKEARSREPRCLIISVSLGSAVGSKSAAINRPCKCRLILSAADGGLRILCLWEVKWQANWQEKQYTVAAPHTVTHSHSDMRWLGDLGKLTTL